VSDAKKRVLSHEERERLAGTGHRFVARGHDVVGDETGEKTALPETAATEEAA